MTGPLHLQRGSVRVYPVVPLTVCDAYIRRGPKQARVIGTLLGTATDNVIEVTSCFSVPHSESLEQVSVDINHHRTMLELHQKVYPGEGIVGWFSTGSEVSSIDTLIQDFYANVTSNPVYLLIDTGLQNDKLSIQAHISRPVSLKGKHVATEFVELECTVQMEDAEKVGLQLLQNGSTGKLPTESEGFLTSFKKLQCMVDDIYNYVDRVVTGREDGDPRVGRYLADTLAAVPHLDKDEFERLFNERMQELLLVLYLANLVKAQICMGDKLTLAAPMQQ